MEETGEGLLMLQFFYLGVGMRVSGLTGGLRFFMEGMLTIASMPLACLVIAPVSLEMRSKFPSQYKGLLMMAFTLVNAPVPHH